jgi:antitoxin component of MazEF toxin-antitoxin module
LAQALEIEKGETIECVVEDKRTLIVRRRPVHKRRELDGK